MPAVIPLEDIPSDRRAQLKQLRAAPKVGWPTIALCAVLVCSYVATIWAGVSNLLPLWAGMVINSLIFYYAFTVIHDSLHRSISRNSRLNDVVGHIATLILSPYSDPRLFRWIHMLHHRFAGGDKDPDRRLKGKGWSVFVRLMFMDYHYFAHAIQCGDERSRQYMKRTFVYMAIVLAVISVLLWMGYAMEVLMLWFIPTRVGMFLVAVSFSWLPHLPHDTEQESNFTRATTVRIGMEWLTGTVLQGHHYHLIHHIYPTLPFYKNFKVWKTIEPELREKDLAIQRNFSISPAIHRGRDNQAATK